MSYSLTKRHFNTFKRAVEKYMARYNLTGWHLEFHHEESEHMASVVVQYEAHRVDVYLAPLWDEEPTREKLYAKAQHEVCHVLVSKLSSVATRRYLSETDVTDAEEELVIRLMTLLPAL